ncbi:hypothetical protein Acsp03_26500 [Actinomadura sp. NBRC 104412]|uniref:hypothetical protein n=1 Tax=Actinomadura sp. NBRC 104412 TaxID=3032203 RepID=UPI00249FAACA|nr:hypothetical protein [Actinomadura sp. NBRC 104412]GLZ05184.1 hypothetical protein Acsp03_26500 [Actinomadura sp. NBRC 104412]
MTVTDRAVATLRTLLKGELEEHERLLNAMDENEANIGYSALVNAAFFEAARRRFLKDGKPASDAEVIDYVAYARSWSDRVAEDIDPSIAETVINMAIEKIPANANKELDNNAAYTNKLMLLAVLTRDANYSEGELEEFMEQTQELAAEIVS